MDERLKRIKEIEEERDKLAIERDKLQSEIREEKEKIEKEEKSSFIGKYFKAINKSNSYKDVIAFKILSLDIYDPLKTARCLAIIDNTKEKVDKNIGVINQRMHLWSYDTLRMMNKKGDALTIDFFKEISEEEFLKIKKETLLKMETFIDEQK